MTATEPEPNPLARRQLLAVAEGALQRAGVMGVLPTPLHAVEASVGVRGVLDMSDLPADMAAKKPSRWRRIVGAYLFREEVMFIDRSQSAPRVRFVEAHELAHKLIPWHQGSFQMDNEEQIFADVEAKLEVEAKVAGSHLIFQGRGFMQRALAYELRLDTPIALSDTYGASMHATIRHYVEQHHDDVVLLVAGRFLGGDGGLPILSCSASATFKERFGDLAVRIKPGRLSVQGGQGYPFGDIIHACLSSSGTVGKDMTIKDLNLDPVTFRAEAFFNQYVVFVMCSRHHRLRSGRRLRIQAT